MPAGSDTPAGERDLAALAVAAGLLRDGEPMPAALQAYSLALVHTCARIGDGYWREDASAGQHIRAVFYP